MNEALTGSNGEPVTNLTPHEWKLLRECAGIEPASSWGAWVGACLEALRGHGFVDRRGVITDAGRRALEATP